MVTEWEGQKSQLRKDPKPSHSPPVRSEEVVGSNQRSEREREWGMAEENRICDEMGD